MNGPSEEIVDYHYDKFFASDPGGGEEAKTPAPAGPGLLQNEDSALEREGGPHGELAQCVN